MVGWFFIDSSIQSSPILRNMLFLFTWSCNMILLTLCGLVFTIGVMLIDPMLLLMHWIMYILLDTVLSLALLIILWRSAVRARYKFMLAINRLVMMYESDILLMRSIIAFSSPLFLVYSSTLFFMIMLIFPITAV